VPTGISSIVLASRISGSKSAIPVKLKTKGMCRGDCFYIQAEWPILTWFIRNILFQVLSSFPADVVGLSLGYTKLLSSASRSLKYWAKSRIRASRTRTGTHKHDIQASFISCMVFYWKACNPLEVENIWAALISHFSSPGAVDISLSIVTKKSCYHHLSK
jgi:hypothetical protein